ncbi:MAG: dTMP kinase [Candidatus Peribacteraceae bacterium]|nr:dTMP kinase [Candidatus Peribacteraceae bacterium]
MPGTFIVLEGPDGAGTTKHSKLLADRLTREGRAVVLTFEPTDGPIGSEIRRDLHTHKPIDPLALQKRFCEDRAWHLREVIEPALARGETVISDRSFHSTIAYGEALGLPHETLRAMTKDFRRPDILLVLLPPFSVLGERMGKREAHDALEKRDLQKKVYAAYQRLAAEDPSAIVIDTSGPLEEAAERVARLSA